jgi:dipeptidyl aminopeptidase/acylaminoacyl peptidase
LVVLSEFREQVEAMIAVIRELVVWNKSMQFYLFVLISFLLTVEASAQTDRTDREDMFRRYLAIQSYTTGGRIEATWMADGNSFWYSRGSADSVIIRAVDPATNRSWPLFDVDRVRKNVSAILGRPPLGKALPFSTFDFIDQSESVARFDLGDDAFLIRMDDNSVTLIDRAEDAGIGRGSSTRSYSSPDDDRVAEIRDHNLWIQRDRSGQPEQVTFDGQSDQIEWCAYDTPVWSSDGRRLLVTRWDFRNVDHIPIVDWSSDQQEIHWEEAPLPSGPGRSMELFLVEVESSRLVKVDTREEVGRYFFPLRWSEDGSEVYFLSADRGFQNLDLVAADSTGATRTILTESSETFVVGLPLFDEHDSLFAPVGERFIWMSERDGWNHLYLYDNEGTLIRQLTRGAWPVVRVVRIDEVGGWVYFTARGNPERPYDTHVYRVKLSGGPVKKLTEQPGQHAPVFSPSGAYFLDAHSSNSRPWSTDLRQADGTLVRTISEASLDVAEDTLQWTPPEGFSVKAADGVTDIAGVLYKPWDFDPAMKYPVIEFMYAGPDALHVPTTFAQRPVYHAMAQLGFIVFALDARGTPGRSKSFQDVVYGNFGRHEIPDHVAALHQLMRSHSYMDSTRVGVYGYSWGGYFATRAMLLAPDTYHVGVAQSADGDLDDHRGAEMVIYMGTPQERPSAYEYGSNTRLADNLEGRLLLIQGARDGHVPLSSTMRLIEAFIEAGKPFDLLLLPNSGHSFSNRAEAMYVLDAIRAYFVEHLAP